mmetsp:Transcript_5430/g.8014  ORF Transcript_5430/g.8014 Transcript_5430/m.8014 type:complete len:1058 (-) Transcript_5430:2574-5747(-)
MEQIERMQNEVNIIIHCAATVSFFERLDIAVNLNTFGALRMMNFAKTCKNIEVFNHVSTMYTNSNQPNNSRVSEKIYPLNLPGGEDIQEFCARVSKMSPDEIAPIQRDYLKKLDFPNTYTFTKNMAEKLVERNKGHVKLAILRPSIVGCSWLQPQPGWVDTVSAAGAIYFFIGIGATSTMWLVEDAITDQIPVDYVANSIILSTADVGTKNYPEGYKVYHSGSSGINPVTWGYAHKLIVKYFQSHRPLKAKYKAETSIIGNKSGYKSQFLLDHTWQNQYRKAVATITGSEKMKNKYEKYKKREEQTLKVNKNFSFFCTHSWTFSLDNYEMIRLGMDEEEQEMFQMDLRLIDWDEYMALFGYGLQKYIMKEKPAPPRHTNVVQKDDVVPGTYIPDLIFAYYAKSGFNTKKKRNEMKSSVLRSEDVQKAIDEETQEQGKHRTDVEKRAKEIMEGMFANPRMQYVRGFSYLLRKIWRKLYSSIVVDEGQLERIKSIVSDPSSGPLVIIPTHRSYIDFLIMSYVFFTYNMPIPHIAAGQDFLNMFLVRDLFRFSGAFFLRRSFQDDPLYKTIFQEYVQQILGDGCSLEFFVEGTRSRANKTLQPKFGLLSIICSALLQKKVNNLTILPINISYEKVLENGAYSNELQGQSKTKESLSNLLKARGVVKNNYGDIHIRFAEPISLKNYIDHVGDNLAKNEIAGDFTPATSTTHQKFLVKQLGYKIAYSLNEVSTLTVTSIVAMLLLRHRDGIEHDQLDKEVETMRKWMKGRGTKPYWNKNVSLRENTMRAINLMGDIIMMQGSMISVDVPKKKYSHRYIQLLLYRNPMMYLIIEDALIFMSIFSLINSTSNRTNIDRALDNMTFSLDEVKENAAFIRNLLHSEFIYRSDDLPIYNFDKFITLMKRDNMIASAPDGRIRVTDKPKFYSFCNCVWPLVDTYWVAAKELLVKQSFKSAAFVSRIQWLCAKLIEDEELLFAESSSTDTIKNTIATYYNSGVLERQKGGVYKVIPKVTELTNLSNQISTYALDKEQFKQILFSDKPNKQPPAIKDRLRNKWRTIKSNL